MVEEENKEEILKSVEQKLKSNSSDLKRFKENPWIVSTFFLGLICSVLILIFFMSMRITGNVIAGEDASEKITDYLNSRVGGGVEYISHEDLGNIYQVTVSYQGRELPVYITKDGEYFVQGIVPLTSPMIPEQQTQQPQDIPKSDKPVVELFVMTHCPYGTQAEKGLIPTIKALGDTVDAKIRFVHYFMHGDKEEEETMRQVCIREQHPDKYLDYLACFLEDGDSQRCLGLMNLNVDSCITDQAEDYYSQDSELSEGYGVRGSPTLVVNGQIVQSGRNSAAYLDTICSAFNTPPAECSQTLSSENPSPGFGYSKGGGSSAGQC